MENISGISFLKYSLRGVFFVLLKRMSYYSQMKQEDKIFLKEKITTIGLNDNRYPGLLKEISSPPSILYVKGKIPAGPAIAVVGSRLATGYGLDMAARLSRELAARGIVIVSGLALGIDTAAHKAALEVGGKTVAVLGSGLDEKSIYPAQNINLAREIVEKDGAVISEFPSKTSPLPHHFPQRNRIVSGLSLGVLVVEARQKSGALITANFALHQNREVFALPGSASSQSSAGTNKLIQQGAKLVLSADDILEELNIETKREETKNAEEKINFNDLSGKEKIIAEIISRETLNVDKIIETTKLSASEVLAALSILEIKGIAKQADGKYELK